MVIKKKVKVYEQIIVRAPRLFSAASQKHYLLISQQLWEGDVIYRTHFTFNLEPKEWRK